MDERAGHAGQGLGVDWGARVDAQNAGYAAHKSDAVYAAVATRSAIHRLTRVSGSTPRTRAAASTRE